MIEKFKHELKVLLARYPQVKNVKFSIEETLDNNPVYGIQSPAVMSPIPQGSLEVATDTALNATLAGLGVATAQAAKILNELPQVD